MPDGTTRAGPDVSRLTRTFVLVLFVGTLLHGLGVLALGWENTILDIHGFRQSQTAISVYYLLQGGAWIAYETPVLGPLWTIPMEFPLYQWIVAVWVKASGMPLDQAGRTISIGAFLVSLWLVYLCLEHWQMSRSRRLIFLTLILASPIYLFWSRTFMIESLALCLCLAYLLHASRFMREPRWSSIVLACLFGCLAGVTKVTTFFAFCLAAALLLVGMILPPSGGTSLRERVRAHRIRALAVAVGCALIPLGVVLVWTRYADALKGQVPFAANFITSTALLRWNFGNWDQRVSSYLWRDVTLGRIVPDTFGSWVVPAIVMILFASSFIWLKRHRFAFVGSLLLFLATHLTFTNLHVVHNYYQYANAIFLLAAAGFCIVALIDSGRDPLVGHGALALALLVGSGIYGYHERFAHAASHNHPAPPIVDAIREHISEEGIVLIYGADWSSEIPYYAQRRAIMDMRFRPIDDIELQQTLALLGKHLIEGVVSCGMRRVGREGLLRRLTALGFAESPVEVAEQCELYLPLASGEPTAGVPMMPAAWTVEGICSEVSAATTPKSLVA